MNRNPGSNTQARETTNKPAEKQKSPRKQSEEKPVMNNQESNGQGPMIRL